jgi:hypothetical protein
VFFVRQLDMIMGRDYHELMPSFSQRSYQLHAKDFYTANIWQKQLYPV